MITTRPLDIPFPVTDEAFAPVEPFAEIINASGTLITPTPGMRLRARWFWAQARASNGSPVLVTFKGSVRGDMYIASLEASQPFAHTAIVDLEVDETIDIELDVNVDVIVGIDYRELEA